jgi:hypothetical protein
MTNPVDDAGNPRVDFVWGPFPIQPNDQRTSYGQDIVTNQDQNMGWTTIRPIDSANLATGWDIITRNSGDGFYEEITNGRQEITIYDSHAEFVIDGYEGYPGFQTGGVFDDIIPNVTIPNIVGLSVSEAANALDAANVPYNNDGITTVGATSGNNNSVANQSVDAGLIFNAGDVPTVHFQTYHYVVVVPINHNLAGIRPDSGDGDNYRFLYLMGRNSGIQVGDQITLHDTGVDNYNRPFDVTAVANDDSFNTGGQKITIRNGLMDGTGGNVTNTGTYTKP